MLYFITGNKNKFEEVKAILPEVEQLDIDLPEIQEIDAKEIIKAKLNEALNHHKGDFIVEDTSLYLDCLNGLPGPLIKWFLATIKNEGLADIAEKFGNDRAEAKTIIGHAKNHDEIYPHTISSARKNIREAGRSIGVGVNFFEGVVKGKIVKPQGETNFGWDPIFMPDGYDKTFAEIGKEEKNKISMRRMALDKLKEFLGK